MHSKIKQRRIDYIIFVKLIIFPNSNQKSANEKDYLNFPYDNYINLKCNVWRVKLSSKCCTADCSYFKSHKIISQKIKNSRYS